MLDSQLDAIAIGHEPAGEPIARFEIDMPVTRSGEMVIDGRLVRRQPPPAAAVADTAAALADR